MTEAARYVLERHRPAVIRWAVAQCLKRPAEAPAVVAHLEPNEAARDTVLRGLRHFAKRPQDIPPE